MKIKMMTYNIQSGHNLQRDRDVRHAVSTIRGENPDILNLNEVHHCTELCENGKCQAEQIAEALGYPYVRFGKAIDHMGGQYGNALLSRFPILESQVFPIPGISEEEKKLCVWPEDRSHMRNVLDINGREIVVLSVHYGLNPPEQKNAVAETLRLSEEENRPLVFLGDLNMEPDNPLLAPVFAALSDTAEKGEGSMLTYPSDEPTGKIDYLFQKGFETLRSYVPVSTDSDHRPVAAVLELEEK